MFEGVKRNSIQAYHQAKKFNYCEFFALTLFPFFFNVGHPYPEYISFHVFRIMDFRTGISELISCVTLVTSGILLQNNEESASEIFCKFTYFKFFCKKLL